MNRHRKQPMLRRGFTLTELLVATIVFLVGFVSVFALFLGGMKMRKLAEDTTRSSLAASCLIDEIRIDAGGGGGGMPQAPHQYIGDGFATFKEGTNFLQGDEGHNSNDLLWSLDNPLFRYKPIPGVWYRVMNATDLNGGDDPQTTVIKLDLLVVPLGTADTTLTFSDLNRRLSVFSGMSAAELRVAKVEQLSAILVARGIGFRYQAVVTRRPSWLP
jgi:prepilin-type N-terminal cleavage/methylation domain-containing protein